MKQLILMSTFLMLIISCDIFKNTNSNLPVDPIRPFATIVENSTAYADIKKRFKKKDFKVLNLKPEVVKEILAKNQDTMSLTIPYLTQDIQVSLKKEKIRSDDFKVTLSSQKRVVDLPAAIYYSGYIKDEATSSVSLAINANEISGFIISNNFNLSLGKVNKASSAHIIYEEQAVQDSINFDCQTEDDGMGYKNAELQPSTNDDLGHRCVRLYVEVDHDIFDNQGGLNETLTFVDGLMSQVIMLYRQENITIEISEIFVWDTEDTYASGISAGLNDFVAARTNFDGNLAHLLSFRSGDEEPENTANAGGKANGIGGLCVTANTELSPHAHTALFPDFASFPNFSRQVKVVTHEIGHNLGARHTHACAWNGNNTAIDGCSGFTEGSCTTPEDPKNGGTIMSYCDRTEVGIDFRLGFGEQPGNVIRNRVENMTCQSNCAINREDCLTFIPANLRIQPDGDRYLLTDGRSRMMLFKDKTAAEKAVSTIKAYRLNKHCFAVRPNPGLRYLLFNDDIPQGSLPNEDCISITSPNNLTIRENSPTSFSIIDTRGNNVPYSAKSREEAEKIISIVKKYNARYTCYVSRPNPGMVYLRR